VVGGISSEVTLIAIIVVRGNPEIIDRIGSLPILVQWYWTLCYSLVTSMNPDFERPVKRYVPKMHRVCVRQDLGSSPTVSTHV
jgi:hypothetical protein